MGVVWSIMKAIVFLLFVMLSLFRGFLILGSVFIFRGRKWVFEEKKRDNRPDCMNDPSLGTHKTVRVKGLNFHLVVSGDTKNPLMIFLHGFPESWYSWRHQIREFNKDFYCVALDMRGVGETDAPLGVKHYAVAELIEDVRELVKVLGYNTCNVVGHDWGGMVAWNFVAKYPEMVEKFINMNIPHPDRFKKVIESSIGQLMMSWYMVFFQVPYCGELMMSMHDYEFTGMCSKVGSYTEDDIEASKYSISRPGRLTSFMNYYRAALRYPVTERLEKIRPPTLLIWGTGDEALHTDNSYGTEKYCDDLTVERIDGGHHFIQQDKPQLVNEIMRKFLFKK